MKPLLYLILTSALAAQDSNLQKIASLATLDGKTFTNVTVTKVTGAEIRFTHNDGIASLPLTKLPPDLQKLFGYDETLAAGAMQEKAAAAAEAEKKQAANAALQAQQRVESEAIRAVEQKAVFVEYQVLEKRADGCDVRLWSLSNEVIKGKRDFSGRPMTQVVKRECGTEFVHGLDAASGATGQCKLYPALKRDYATSAALSFRLQREADEKKAQELAAKQAAAEAQKQAALAAAAERIAAREAAKNKVP